MIYREPVFWHDPISNIYPQCPHTNHFLLVSVVQKVPAYFGVWWPFWKRRWQRQTSWYTWHFQSNFCLQIVHCLLFLIFLSTKKRVTELANTANTGQNDFLVTCEGLNVVLEKNVAHGYCADVWLVWVMSATIIDLEQDKDLIDFCWWQGGPLTISCALVQQYDYTVWPFSSAENLQIVFICSKPFSQQEKLIKKSPSLLFAAAVTQPQNIRRTAPSHLGVAAKKQFRRRNTVCQCPPFRMGMIRSLGVGVWWLENGCVTRFKVALKQFWAVILYNFRLVLQPCE